MKAEKKTKSLPVKESDDLQRQTKELEVEETKVKKSSFMIRRQ